MSQLAKENSLDGASPLSTPPTVPDESTGLGPHVTRATIAPGSARGSGTVTPSIGSTISTKERILAAHLDITPSLQKAVHSVVKARNGSVLSRGFILKTDHYPSGESLELFGGQGLCRLLSMLPDLRYWGHTIFYSMTILDLSLTVAVLSR